MKRKYYIPIGSWPLRTKPYHELLKKLNWEPGDSDSADVLILPGGADLGMRPERDKYEFKILKKFKEMKKPVIGICRGMQILLHKFPMIKHIPDNPILEQHTTISGDWKGKSTWHKTHLGFSTNSRHHQGFLKKDIKNWNIIDWTSDNIVEAVYKDNLFGVQWHPEHEEMNNTFAQEWWLSTVKKLI